MDRDDFSLKTKEIVRKRAAYICSNPKCRCLTLSPSGNDPEKFIYTGEVAHITAAAVGGPRYNRDLTEEQRSSADNAIHLCSTCATMVDKNQGIDFSDELLRQWKEEHERWVAESLNRRLAEILQDEQTRRDLVLRMGSPTNPVAIEAVRALRAQGGLQDGTLESASLSGADLQYTDLSDACLKGVDLSGANLQDTNLTRANLEDATLKASKLRRSELCGANLKNVDLTEVDLKDARGLTDEQLVEANSLLGATMVSGKRYNGRFNLEGDLLLAHLMKIGQSDQAMACFYEVSVENYRWGQKWNKFSQSPPVMYSPDLEEWYRLDQSPEGVYDNE
ncbi:MAG: pentapeptide repeat-containing protein [Anaerolineae bacterium]|nr:pentapeptide repeat-containing protein [Anaerolineae bacterium]